MAPAPSSMDADAVGPAHASPTGNTAKKMVAADRFAPPTWTHRFWFLGTATQVVIVAAIATFIFGQLAIYTVYFNVDFKADATAWWGKHTEMIRPTFFILFCIVPLGATLLLVEFLKLFNIHRMSSRTLLKLAMVCRRKPRFRAWVSPYSYGELVFLAVVITGNCLAFSLSYTRRLDSAKLAAKKAKKVVTYAKKLNVLGVSLGYTSVFNLAFLFLPATRSCAWMEFLNISYANGVKYHRWMGLAAVVLAQCHCIVFFVLWGHNGEWKAQALPCFDCSLGAAKGKRVWINIFGEIALLLVLVIYVTSLGWVRRRYYEVFYYVHHLAFPAMVFTVMHYNGIVWWILPSFLLYLINRALSSANAFAPVQIKEFIALDHDIAKIVVARSAALSGHYKLGQFVYLNVPAVSRLQWHAFTISSSPRASPDTLTLLLKSLGDWTHALVEHTDACKAKSVLPTVYTDGFYGASLEMYDEYPTVCLVGGGIGMTPLLAILEDMVVKVSTGTPMAQRVYLIFAFRDLSLLEEIHPLLACIRELDPSEKFFTFHLSLTKTPTAEALAKPIDHKRLGGDYHTVATGYDQPTKLWAPLPPQRFSQPLRSPVRKCAMYTAVFTAVVVIVSVLEYGSGKIKRKGHGELWPLQAFVQLLILFLSALIVYGVVVVEKVVQARTKTESSGAQGFFDVFKAPATAAMRHYENNIETFQDLLTAHAVKVGERPNLDLLVRLVRQSHQTFVANNEAATRGRNGTIGVFVSGPASLKQAVHFTVASTAPSEFGVHEEEFKL